MFAERAEVEMGGQIRIHCRAIEALKRDAVEKETVRIDETDDDARKNRYTKGRDAVEKRCNGEWSVLGCGWNELLRKVRGSSGGGSDE